MIDIPACIDDYNHHKVGVDLADQFRSYYSTQLISNRTWYPIFFWILDTMLINAYKIWLDLDQEGVKDISHKDFRMYIAWELILRGKKADLGNFSNRLSGRDQGSHTNPERSQSTQAQPPPKTRITTQFIIPELSECISHHRPVFFEQKSVCFWCRYQD